MSTLKNLILYAKMIKTQVEEKSDALPYLKIAFEKKIASTSKLCEKVTYLRNLIEELEEKVNTGNKHLDFLEFEVYHSITTASNQPVFQGYERFVYALEELLELAKEYLVHSERDYYKELCQQLLWKNSELVGEYLL